LDCRFQQNKLRVVGENLWRRAGFVTINGAIRFVFEAEDPFAANSVHVKGERNESLGVVVYKGIEFKVHCFTPTGCLEAVE